MKIHCIDQSSAKLFLAVDFLCLLNRLEAELTFNFSDREVANYGGLFNFFPKLGVSEKTAEANADLTLVFSDLKNLSARVPKGKTIIFPILQQSELSEYNQICQSKAIKDNITFLPLYLTAVKSCEYLTPNALWAMDLLQCAIGPRPLQGLKVLISTGPTVEDIDPIRFISNRSSGKMGVALARAAFIKGAQTHMVAGPTLAEIPNYLTITKVRSASQMTEAVLDLFSSNDVYIASAAVADFSPAEYQEEKIKKKNDFLVFKLKKTEDILMKLKSIRMKQILVGFSVETSHEIENSRLKLINKDLDLIVINNPRDRGAAFGEETNKVTVLFKGGGMERWPLMSKFEVGNKILDIVGKLFKNRSNE